MEKIEVEVYDPYLIARTMKIEEIKKVEIITIRAVGFLVCEDKEKIVICQSIYPEEDEKENGYSEPFFLPKCAIKKIIRLKEVIR